MAGDVTSILAAATEGDQRAADQLLPLVYEQLRALAAAYLHTERPGHTLQPTALVNEAYLKLVEQSRAKYESRAHFFAIAATAMRRILVNHANARSAAKRGGGDVPQVRVSLDAALDSFQERAIDLEALDEALNRLAVLDERQARLVEMRFFGGMTAEEAATAVGMSPRTAEREWASARAWLHAEVSKGGAA
jgi:RNA polymerase sigma-70 factor, ECF subfamily